jgi:hypothetical protein
LEESAQHDPSRDEEAATESIVRKGQTVYAADGTYLGGVLQFDSSFIVVGRSRWTSDHVIIPVEEVAASESNLLILRDLPDAVRSETAEPWSPPPDPSGNANGVDIEPLRAGMAELEDRCVGIARIPEAGAEARASIRGAEGDALLPSPEDARALTRERIAKLDSEVDRCILEELEDFAIGSACASPASEEAAGTDATRETVTLSPRSRSLHVQPSDEVPARASARARPPITRAATKAAQSRRALERIVQSSGFSRAEAQAIAAGGFAALVALVDGSG